MWVPILWVPYTFSERRSVNNCHETFTGIFFSPVNALRITLIYTFPSSQFPLLTKWTLLILTNACIFSRCGELPTAPFVCIYFYTLWHIYQQSFATCSNLVLPSSSLSWVGTLSREIHYKKIQIHVEGHNSVQFRIMDSTITWDKCYQVGIHSSSQAVRSVLPPPTSSGSCFTAYHQKPQLHTLPAHQSWLATSLPIASLRPTLIAPVRL